MCFISKGRPEGFQGGEGEEIRTFPSLELLCLIDRVRSFQSVVLLGFSVL